MFKVKPDSLLTRFLKKLFTRRIYDKVAKMTAAEELTFMNWGYAPTDDSEPAITMNETDEFNRYQIQMYHYLAAKQSITGLNVLEVGSGRGGGAEYLNRTFNPASFIGLDISPIANELSIKRYQSDTLKFQVGNAQELPFPDDTFDRVMNIESSHCYPKPLEFFKEACRVLKPGGYFLITDFRNSAESDSYMETLATLKNHITEAGFTIESFEDITPNVLKSLDMDDQRKRDFIDSMPDKVKKKIGDLMIELAALKGDRNYNDFADGTKGYYRLVCKK